MPKIIYDIEKTIQNEAKKQVLENGYSHMTVRSVAKECGIAVGTIYNYYKSKEMLTASFMLSDWFYELDAMKHGCEENKSPSHVMRCVYDGLCRFYDKYRKMLFEDSDAEKSYATAFGSRHDLLRSQLASLLQETCEKEGAVQSKFLPEFIAGALLNMTAEERDFDEINEILILLFQKNK